MSAGDIKAAAQDLLKGGTWKDEALDQSLDWQGDNGSIAASVDEKKTYEPKTHVEIENELYKEHSISPEVIAFITKSVEKSLLRSSGSENKTLVQMVESTMARTKDEIEAWMTNSEKRLAAVESEAKSSGAATIARIDEHIAALEIQLQTLAGSVVQYGAEETRLLHEAHKVIMTRKTSDPPDDTSEPSIYDRMEKRLGALNQQLKQLEPMADRGFEAVQNAAAQRSNVRKKFGKLM
jgi:hypothetical protein